MRRHLHCLSFFYNLVVLLDGVALWVLDLLYEVVLGFQVLLFSWVKNSFIFEKHMITSPKMVTEIIGLIIMVVNTGRNINVITPNADIEKRRSNIYTKRC